MSETSPYTSPQAQQQQQPPFPPQQIRSSVPKVFGILHIIYAVFGIIFGLMAFASKAIVEGIQLNAGSNDPAVTKIMDALDNVLFYGYIDAAVKIILGIVLLIAGIKLLKYQASGLKLSNMWSISRVIWYVIITAMSYSATKAYQEVIFEANPEAAAMMKNFGAAGQILGFLIIAAYPIVSYIVLNKPNVKKDLV